MLPAVSQNQVHVRAVEDLAELGDREVAPRRQHLLLALGEAAEGQKPENGCERQQFSVDQHVVREHREMQLLLFCEFDERLDADRE